MTRRLTVLIATCAVALGATAGSASAAQPDSPGCKGEITSGTVHTAKEAFGANGLDAVLDVIHPLGFELTHEDFRVLRDQLCAPSVF
jgi:hypothetical protein